VIINLMDIMFAMDSIPAILAITTDPFLVYTSNIFAIIGLRAMFFLLSGLMEEFHHLKKGLAVILAFIGVKMLMVDFFKIPTAWALGVIALVLTVSILASRIWPPAKSQESKPHVD
jgi:tellurite resistance protein TerC